MDPSRMSAGSPLIRVTLSFASHFRSSTETVGSLALPLNARVPCAGNGARQKGSCQNLLSICVLFVMLECQSEQSRPRSNTTRTINSPFDSGRIDGVLQLQVQNNHAKLTCNNSRSQSKCVEVRFHFYMLSFVDFDALY